MRYQSPAQLLAELDKSSDLNTQLGALKRIKNEIVGHPQKKEVWIHHGILDVLGRILSAYHRTTSLQPAREHDSEDAAESRLGQQPGEDLVLQAIIVVGSIAQGGSTFVDPLAAAQIIPTLASMLNPATSSQRVILGVLRALNTYAESSRLLQWQDRAAGSWQIRQIYSPPNVSFLVRIMEQNSAAPLVQQQMALTAVLIGRTCDQEFARQQLTASGMLEALAAQLVPFILESSNDLQSDFQYHSHREKPNYRGQSRARLAPLLQAVASIIRNDPRRTMRFLRASPFSEAQLSIPSWRWNGELPKARVAAHTDTNSSPVSQSSAHASTFPPLGGLAVMGKSKPPGRRILHDLPANVDFEETALASWLTHLIQREQSLTKLMAAWLLAILFKDGVIRKDRETSLSMQLVPVIARMLDSESTDIPEYIPAYDHGVIEPRQWLIKRLAPHVLGLLVSDSKQLQLAASEAQVIKKLSQLLRHTFDAAPREESRPMWDPQPESMQEPPSSELSSTKLGQPGLSRWTCQALQMRESVLEALASMATQEDDLRKAIIGNGVVQHIVASLRPDPAFMPPGIIDDQPGKLHNPIPVLMQACAAATALSRSVSTLRTSLIDAGLAKPIFGLLRNPDMNVQIAATGATCNIVLEFSPMRQEMIEDGVLEVLCKQAHSSHLHLRLNSLWALKHLVHAAPNSLKINCVEHLGVGWLKQIISNEPDYAQRPSPLGMGTANAAGERVDLLNSEDHMPVHLQRTNDDDEVLMADDMEAQEAYTGSSRSKGSLDLDEETERAAKLRREVVAVQEQALHLIRNLISGTGSGEMLDYIFQEFGQQMLFDILTNQLRSRPAEAAFGRAAMAGAAAGPGGPVRHVSPAPDVVAAVIHILSHMAGGGLARHRQVLMAQTETMRLASQLSTHPAPEVRIAFVWLVINLTWLEDAGDRYSVRARVLEVRKLGMVDRIHALEHDPNLDVRERAKTAVNQINEAEGSAP